MPRHAMTPHYSGTTLTAQARYAAGTKEILDRYFKGEDQVLSHPKPLSCCFH
jgi:formate dehydrogenase